MAQSLPKARQGLGESQPKGARVLAPRLNPPHAQKTLQSGLKSPDGLLTSFTRRSLRAPDETLRQIGRLQIYRKRGDTLQSINLLSLGPVNQETIIHQPNLECCGEIPQASWRHLMLWPQPHFMFS